MIRISGDGRGRALDHIFIERLWLSLKHEYLCLNEYENGPELHEGLEIFACRFLHIYFLGNMLFCFNQRFLKRFFFPFWDLDFETTIHYSTAYKLRSSIGRGVLILCESSFLRQPFDRPHSIEPVVTPLFRLQGRLYRSFFLFFILGNVERLTLKRTQDSGRRGTFGSGVNPGGTAR